MILDSRYLEMLREAQRELSESAAMLGDLLARETDFTVEEFDTVCDTLNAAAARLRYVRVFIEQIEFADPDDTLS